MKQANNTFSFSILSILFVFFIISIQIELTQAQEKLAHIDQNKIDNSNNIQQFRVHQNQTIFLDSRSVLNYSNQPSTEWLSAQVSQQIIGQDLEIERYRQLQISTQKSIEKRDNTCHFSCLSCLDDNYYSCTSCYGNRIMKATVNEEVSICKCAINSVDEGPGLCSSSSNKNLELAIKALFSSAFGVNLFTSFVVWNPMYFLGFTEFSQAIGQLAYVNKYNVLNFDEITNFITYSHMDKIFTLRMVSDSKIGRSDKLTGGSNVQQNPKIFLNDKDTSYVINAITIILLHAIAWIISVSGRNNIKYKHLLSISTPLVIYLLTFCDMNFLSLFQLTTGHFESPLSRFSFFAAIFSLIYLFAFSAYIFYYISIKQVLNEEKQTSKLKQYINELHQLIMNNPEHDNDDVDDDASSKQSHKTTTKLHKDNQNADDINSNKDNGNHSMILQNLDNSHNIKGSPSNNKDGSPSHSKKSNDQYPNSKHLEADSTYFDNESPIKMKKMQFMSEILSKNKSSADLISSKKQEEMKVIDLDKNEDEKHSSNINENENNKNEIRSIEEGLESNKQMRVREEELKLKLIEQEFNLQQYRSMFYLFFILLKQSNSWQRGFYTALIFRKILFAIINLYVFDNPQTQMVLLLIVDVAYFAYCIASRPFAWRLHNIFFFFFEGIALLCYIIFTSIASEDTDISVQITAIKTLLSLLIFAFIVYIALGLSGVVLFILNLIKGPKSPLEEEQEVLKDHENKKSTPDEEEDDYSMTKKKQNIKQKQGEEGQENYSPQQNNILSRNDSPPILLHEQSENLSPYKNKLIKPFKGESIVLLEADEEDDDDFNINKKVQSKQENDERPDDHIRRPIKYQLTQIRKQAEELFQQQKDMFERNRDKRIAKTMILEGGTSNRLAVTEQDGYDNNNNNKKNEYNGNMNTLGNVGINHSGVNITNRKQNEEEMSFNKNPMSQPYSFRNGDHSQLLGREIEESTARSKILLNSQREHEEGQYSQNPKRGILNLNRSLLQNSISQLHQMGINSNNNSFYTDALNPKSAQGMSEYQTPSNLTPRNIQNQNELDFGEKLSPIASNRQLQDQSSPQKKFTLTPMKIESFGVKNSLQSLENPSKITNLQDNDDNLEQKITFQPGSNSDLERQQQASQKFSFNLKKAKGTRENNDKNDQENLDQIEGQGSTIFTKPFLKIESRFSNRSRQNLDEIDSPLKDSSKNKPHLNLESPLKNLSQQTTNNPEQQIQKNKINQNLKNQLENSKPIEDQQQIINLDDNDDDEVEQGEETIHNIHNESYIPYDPDLKQYQTQMDNIPERKGKGRKNKSVILSGIQSVNNKRLSTAQLHSNKNQKIDENIIEENNQQDDDFNNQIPGPGIAFQ